MTSLLNKRDILLQLRHNSVELPEEIRSMGIHIQAGRGSGKSFLMGNTIAFRDFCQAVPQVIFDPQGATIDFFLAAAYQAYDDMVQAGRLSEEQQEQFWDGIIYVDMSGTLTDRVVPFPLYYRLGQESVADVASRLLDVFIRLNPELIQAPIMGWNSIVRYALPAGMILSTLGYQITEVESLLIHPKLWKDKLLTLRSQTSDWGLKRAIDFFTSKFWLEMKERERERELTSFRSKWQQFFTDNSTLAMFGASKPMIDWFEVVEKGYTVLLDFRHETNDEKRRFKMLWAYIYFLSFATYRAEKGKQAPISLIVDELTELYRFEAENSSRIISADLNRLTNVIGRNYGVWTCMAHQEAWQLDRESLNSLKGMGTQILGVTTDMQSAKEMAEEYFTYDPLIQRDLSYRKDEDRYAYWARLMTEQEHKVKHWKRVWMSDMLKGPFVIDQEPVEYTLEEFNRLGAQVFRNLGLFEFFIKPAKREGDVTGDLIPVKIAEPEAVEWPNESLLDNLRLTLSKRDGIPIPVILQEITQRTAFLNEVRAALEAAQAEKKIQPAPADAPDVDDPVIEPPPQPPLTTQPSIRKDRKVKKRHPTQPAAASPVTDRDTNGEELDSLVQDIVGSIRPDNLIHLALPR